MVYLFIVLFIFFSCKREKEEVLPIYGKFPSESGDTIIRTIENFDFINQDSVAVNLSTFEDKVYVADFFFTSCPAICPAMKRQMLRIYEEFLDNDNILLLSHTIDPKRDTIPKMKEYAQKLGIDNATKWHFVTGEKEELYRMAEFYMVAAYEDEDLPGGFDHSGLFLLIDKEQQIRGYYEGTDEEEVTQLIADMKLLMQEYE